MKNEVYSGSRVFLFPLNLKYFLFLFIFSVNFTHQFPLNTSEITESILRSNGDTRKYYAYNLTNSLEVLIVIDNKTINDGASLTVKVGSSADEDVLGLAHFTEHMLFLGSKKFPKPSYFVDFVTNNQGSFNGYTTIEKTAYYFKIGRDYFSQALDIFSRFFIDPLFDSQNIEKELNAVNSEYQKNLILDGRRKDHILKRFANKKSSYSKFKTGNFKTLKEYCEFRKIDLKERVKVFFDKYYTPDKMLLVIYGSKSVKYYKKLIAKTFALIPERKHEQTGETEDPFIFFNQGHLILYESVQSHMELDLRFVLPNMFEWIPSNPSLFIKTLINDESTNSLVDLLRKNGLVISLKSRLKYIYSKLFYFQILVTLTEKGFDNLDSVLRTINSFFDFIKKSIAEDKPQIMEIYNKMKSHYQNEFISEDKSTYVMKLLSAISSQYLDYPKKYLEAQLKLLDDYNKNTLSKLFEYLSFGNSLILIGTRNLLQISIKDKIYVKDPHAASCMITEPYMFTKYSQHKINLEIFETVPNITAEMDAFLKNINFRQEKQNEQPNRKEEGYTNIIIKIIEKNEDHENYFSIDKNENKDYLNFYLQFIFPSDSVNMKFITFTKFFIYSINLKLKETFNNIKRNKYSINILATNSGLIIKLFCERKKLTDEIVSLIDKLKSLEMTQNDFSIVKEEMKNQYEQITNVQPRLKAFINFFKLVIKNPISISKILKELPTFNLENFNIIYRSLFTRFFTRKYLHGNLQQSEAEIILKKIDSYLNGFRIPSKMPISSLGNYHQSITGYTIYREKVKNKFNKDHAIGNFYQLGESDMRNIILASMIKQIVGDIYFTELRIKRQLGYSVSGKLFTEAGFLYYMIGVQGSKIRPDYIDPEIENVISLMKQKIYSYSDDKMHNLKAEIERRLTLSNKKLNKKTEILWKLILNNKIEEDYESTLIKQLEEVEKRDIINFFIEKFEVKLAKVSIQEFSDKIKILPHQVEFITRENKILPFVPKLYVESEINLFKPDKFLI